MDSRYVFLQPSEYMKIAHSFFDDHPESVQNIVEQIEEHKILAGNQEYVNVTVFLLIMLMEFKRKSLQSKGEEVGEAPSVESNEMVIMSAVAPRLESLLDKVLHKLCPHEDSLKDIGKKELLAVFSDYISKLVHEFVENNLEGVEKILELDEEGSEPQGSFLKDIMAAVQECLQKDAIKDNAEVIADAIFSVLRTLTVDPPNRQPNRHTDLALLEKPRAQISIQ